MTEKYTTKYLVPKDFKGRIQSSLFLNAEGETWVHYANERLLTYLKTRNLNIEDFNILNDTEVEGLFEQHYQTIVNQPPEIISEERYWELLEVLPPCRFTSVAGGSQQFHMLEADTGNIHTWCVKIGQQYCSFYDRNNADAEYVYQRALTFITTQGM